MRKLTQKILLVLLTFISITQESRARDSELPPFPQNLIEELKRYENFDLATGVVTVAERDTDKNGITDIGYGITKYEIEDAIKAGFLPEGSKMPSVLTKKEADYFLENVTIPTYRKIVRSTVKVKLSLNQEVALTFFAQNAGRGSLKRLVDGENRLNDGNWHSVITQMEKHYSDPDLKSRCEFHIALYVGKPFKPKT